MKIHYAAFTLALAASVPAIAQVKVIDEEYRPRGARPAPAPAAAPSAVLPAQGSRAPAAMAVMSNRPADTGFELPIESADVAVSRNSPYLIRKGAPLHAQLQAWARTAGWELFWQPSVSWRAMGDADFNQHKEITAAVEDVVSILRDEGKAVRLRISEGNRIMEVVSNEVGSND
ncbi:TcpQ domain-containing protein [Acidovorax sp.]|uniref:TcpQ domain-containing protein n=1 Tax=Acidovorax sp. TaxID=1872122 RepID=UPI0025C3167C|nr:TcpQ domain-containing protein [Acidovorax sp.]